MNRNGHEKIDALKRKILCNIFKRKERQLREYEGN